MSKKVWFVKWNRPSKVFKGEKVGEWETFPTEQLARKRYEEIKRVKGATDLLIDEAETCSL